MYREMIGKLIEGHDWAKFQKLCSKKAIEEAKKTCWLYITKELKELLCETNVDTYALEYAANDIVLRALAAMQDIRYISFITCFVAFLSNDLYGYVNWAKMKKRQINILNS